MIVDLKTADSVSPRNFARSAHQYGYHRSAAYYTDTINMGTDWTIEHYVFLVVCSSPPFETRTYVLDEDSIEQGRSEYVELLDQWRDCVTSDSWPMGPEVIEVLRLPEYAINYHKEESI